MECPVNVAVVDGSVRARDGLVNRLRQVPGITVVGAVGDAEAALGAVVGAAPPEVVVVDFRRVAPDGAELVRRMATSAPWVGIVVLTAYVTERDRANLLTAGAQAVLVKEIATDSLVHTIRTVAGRAGIRERRPTR